ncbi:MBOAT family O-acyltransferase [Flammeovirga pacifica]|uniref:Membrane-bound O-acyltransferase family protein n=1 Tax=Flammeovirga pacifica TaxID=915059 RepID=A0A1S1YV89_FLAPC|nr:MBOAT family O-acyltransferase [Flammeovirga pacifica]OHX64920.1 membrane-bound O-acyltransferase family protein [Flammeovirga pacifica]
MLFNSLEFTLFIPIVFLLYWFAFQKNTRHQNIFLVISSYVFYGWWDERFLILIFLSTVSDFWIAQQIGQSTNKRLKRKWLYLSLFVNLGVLGFFKYFNFFSKSFTDAFTILGQTPSDPLLLNIILPVGISFYTFQTLSYSLDVYQDKLKPTQDFISFTAYVSFFPQLVAGPIERANHLLPQFQKGRAFSYDKATDGMRQILWGLFKKVVIADNCAEYANLIFSNYEDYSTSSLWLGAIFFSFQIYGDFSGYSDIAIGLSRLFGFELMQNFSTPYFSRDIAEFWRRWHISLSSWFRDYLYIPLGGSRGGTYQKIRNVFIIFIVSGFWHGASWNFIIWGTLNALFILPLVLFQLNRNHLTIVASNRRFPSIKEVGQMSFTFFLTLIAWVFFRSESLTDAFQYLQGMFTFSGNIIPTQQLFDATSLSIKKLFLLIVIFLWMEWINREKRHTLEKFGTTWPRIIRFGFYYCLLIFIFMYSGDEQEFIYFQF